MNKYIITGSIRNKNYRGVNSLLILNGDIELNEQNQEVYITSRKKDNSNESEDVFTLVSEMDQEIQDYIKSNKRYINV